MSFLKNSPHLDFQFRPIRCRKCWAPSPAALGRAVICATFPRDSRNLGPESPPRLASICSTRRIRKRQKTQGHKLAVPR